MTDTAGNDTNWNYPCSDDELLKSGDQEKELVYEKGEWAPTPEELLLLYNTIEKNGVVPLSWRCPGRRSPSIPTTPAPRVQPVNDIMPEKSNFDFKDEVNSLQLRVRREGEDTLRGSAKKKTTSFDGIVSNMMRHKRIQQMEMEADNPS